MSLFAIADTHLSLSGDKPMKIFPGWEDFVERMEKNWRAIVSEDDTVVISGDISWEMRLENTRNDLAFLNSLPGKKIIIKGNHDYWWTSKKKMDGFLSSNGFDTLSILFNNSFEYNGLYICGTRGWSYDCPQSETNILNREVGRLRLSLDSAPADSEKIVFLHYPPVYAEYRCDEIMDVLHEYGIKRCFYGHLHSTSQLKAVIGDCEGIDMRLCSADYVKFSPILVIR